MAGAGGARAGVDVRIRRKIAAGMVCGLVCAWAGVCADIFSGSNDPSAHELGGSRAQDGAARGNVSGRVLLEGTGQGIRKVVIVLTGQNTEARQEYTTSTDAYGQFRLEGVAVGEYNVSVARAGYVRVNPRPEYERITVVAGQELRRLVYQMQPTGVITGKITDAEGDPLQGVSVSVTRVGKSGASLATDMAERGESGQETTNDLGEYRVANLRAGLYLVQAQAHGIGPAPDPADKGRQKDKAVYALTYYPGALETSGASPVRVVAGEMAIANFNLMMSRSFRVSGTVVVQGNPQNVQIFLVSNSGQVEAQGLREGGQFEFANIMPGTYVAQIVDMSGVGERFRRPSVQMIGSPIVVSGGDVTGLVLRPEVGGSVSGKVRTEDGEELDWADLNVSLARVAQDDDLPQMEQIGALGGTTQLKEDGSFELKDVVGGTYQVFLGGQSEKVRDYYLKSVTLDGREVADTGFTVNGLATLGVVVSAKGASVEGTVVDSKGQPVGGATVVSLPGTGKLGRPDSYQTEHADASGHFLLRGMNPGPYVVVALEEVNEDVRKPEFFQKYGEKGEKVELDEGERKSSVTVNLVEGAEK
jgi:protocatechuate 3,4-dioxygenase beta subunit